MTISRSLVRDFSYRKKCFMIKMQSHRISHTRSSPPNTPGCFSILSARLYRKDIHFVSYTNLSEFQYLLAGRVYLRRRASHFHSFSRILQKISTYVHDSSVSPSWKVSPAEATLAVDSVSTCPPGGSPGRVTTREKFGRIHSGTRENHPSFFTTSLVHHPLLFSASLNPFRSLSVSDALFVSPPRCAPTLAPLAHPSMILLAPLSLSLLRGCYSSVSTPDHRRSAFIEPLRAQG